MPATLIYENYLTEIAQPRLKELDIVSKLEKMPGKPHYTPYARGSSSFVENSPNMSTELYSFVYWYSYTKSDISIDIDFPFEYKWWIIKLLPGQFLPPHADPDVVEGSKRYSIFLQNYVTGHVLVEEDKLFTGYKTGEVYKWRKPDSIHYAANTVNIPRYTLQIGTGPGYTE